MFNQGGLKEGGCSGSGVKVGREIEGGVKRAFFGKHPSPRPLPDLVKVKRGKLTLTSRFHLNLFPSTNTYKYLTHFWFEIHVFCTEGTKINK